MGKEAARILAQRIIEGLPAHFKTSMMEWRFIEEKITKLLVENPGLIIASISEEDWLEYGNTH